MVISHLNQPSPMNIGDVTVMNDLPEFDGTHIVDQLVIGDYHNPSFGDLFTGWGPQKKVR